VEARWDAIRDSRAHPPPTCLSPNSPSSRRSPRSHPSAGTLRPQPGGPHESLPAARYAAPLSAQLRHPSIGEGRPILLLEVLRDRSGPSSDSCCAQGPWPPTLPGRTMRPEPPGRKAPHCEWPARKPPVSSTRAALQLAAIAQACRPDAAPHPGHFLPLTLRWQRADIPHPGRVPPAIYATDRPVDAPNRLSRTRQPGLPPSAGRREEQRRCACSCWKPGRSRSPPRKGSYHERMETPWFGRSRFVSHPPRP